MTTQRRYAIQLVIGSHFQFPGGLWARVTDLTTVNYAGRPDFLVRVSWEALREDMKGELVVHKHHLFTAN